MRFKDGCQCEKSKRLFPFRSKTASRHWMNLRFAHLGQQPECLRPLCTPLTRLQCSIVADHLCSVDKSKFPSQLHNKVRIVIRQFPPTKAHQKKISENLQNTTGVSGTLKKTFEIEVKGIENVFTYLASQTLCKFCQRSKT